MQHQPNDDVWKIVAYALAAAVLALGGVVVKIAKVAWDERMGRITDRNETISQLNVMANAAKQKKGVSP